MAAPFRFKLKTVLKLRKRREDEHKRIVAARLGELSTAQRRVEFIRQQIGRETNAVRGSRGTGILSVRNIARHRHWLTHLQKSLLETQTHMRTLEAKLSQERAELRRAAKEAKAIEKLKERQHDRYRLEERRRETRELDETAVLRHARSATGPGPTGVRRRKGRREAAATLTTREDI